MPDCISSERLLIRRVRVGDAGSLHEIWTRIAAIKPWNLQSLEETRTRIAEMVRKSDPTEGLQIFVIELSDDSSLVGHVQVTFGSPSAGQVELGYSLHPDVSGRGVATEALTAMLDHLFDKLAIHRCVALIITDNHPSRRLVEKLGFRHEGLLRESYFLDGQWRDDNLYALLESEWRARRAAAPPS